MVDIVFNFMTSYFDANVDEVLILVLANLAVSSNFSLCFAMQDEQIHHSIDQGCV